MRMNVARLLIRTLVLIGFIREETKVSPHNEPFFYWNKHRSIHGFACTVGYIYSARSFVSLFLSFLLLIVSCLILRIYLFLFSPMSWLCSLFVVLFLFILIHIHLLAFVFIIVVFRALVTRFRLSKKGIRQAAMRRFFLFYILNWMCHR